MNAAYVDGYVSSHQIRIIKAGGTKRRNAWINSDAMTCTRNPVMNP